MISTMRFCHKFITQSELTHPLLSYYIYVGTSKTLSIIATCTAVWPTSTPTLQPINGVHGLDTHTGQPIAQPTSLPTSQPSHQPSSLPTSLPSSKPSSKPSRYQSIFSCIVTKISCMTVITTRLQYDSNFSTLFCCSYHCSLL